MEILFIEFHLKNMGTRSQMNLQMKSWNRKKKKKTMTNYKLQGIHKSYGSPFPFLLLQTHWEDMKCSMTCRKKKNESIIDERNQIQSEQQGVNSSSKGFPLSRMSNFSIP